MRIKWINTVSRRIFFLTVSLLVLSCGEVKTSSYFSPPKTELSQYQALQIEDFVTSIPNLSKEILTQIPDEVEKLLNSKKKGFKTVEHGTIENVPASETLVLLGEVTEYRSSTDLRYEGGAVKFGEILLTVRLALVEKNTGKEISTGEVSGFSSLGFIAKNTSGSLAEEIAKFISVNYR